MSQRGIKNYINFVKSFKAILKNIDVKEVFVFTTASLRNVINTMEAVNKIKIISINEETMYNLVQ